MLMLASRTLYRQYQKCNPMQTIDQHSCTLLQQKLLLSQGQGPLLLPVPMPIWFSNLSFSHILLRQFFISIQILRDMPAPLDPLALQIAERFSHDEVVDLRNKLTAARQEVKKLKRSMSLLKKLFHGHVWQARMRRMLWRKMCNDLRRKLMSKPKQPNSSRSMSMKLILYWHN